MVVQVIDKDKMLIDVQDTWHPFAEDRNKWVMFSGFPTGGATDGVAVRIDSLIRITKTTTYPTAAGGTKTVLVAEPVDMDSLKIPADERAKRHQQAEEKQQKEKQEADAKQQAVEAAKWRTWTDASGTHKTEAKFSGLLSGNVKLTKRDGSVLTLPLEKLSDDDKEWVKKRSK